TERLDGVQYFSLFVAHRIGLKRDRGLHGRQTDELHDVVGNHVAQRTGLIVIAAALLDPHGFGHRDLYVIDVAAIPNGLKDTVGEAKRQDVLYRLFSQVVIDAVDLFFADEPEQMLVQRFGRFEVMAERLFYDYPAPIAVLFLHQSDRGQLLDNGAKEIG